MFSDPWKVVHGGATLPPTLMSREPTAGQDPDAQQYAIAFRDALLANHWPDDAGVAERIGVPAEGDPTQLVRRLRVDGRLLGVWSVLEHRFVHPDFQFDERGVLRPEVAALLSILPHEGDRGGWARAFWLYSPHALLEGRTPASVFAKESPRVIDVAIREFRAEQDGCQ
jgi:hypothetical protein